MNKNEAKAGPVDWIVLAFILVFTVGIGLFYGLRDKIVGVFSKKSASQDPKRSENENGKLDEYQSAKSSMGVLPIALSLMASAFSAIGLVGSPTEIYQYGVDQWFLGLGFATPPILGAFVFGPFFAKIKTQTVFEYIFMRYKSKPLKLLANTVYVLRTFMSTGFISKYIKKCFLNNLNKNMFDINTNICGYVKCLDLQLQ
jgi:Na+/proline symporter